MWTTIAFPFVAFLKIQNCNSYFFAYIHDIADFVMSISNIFIDIWVHSHVDIYLDVICLYLGAFITFFFVRI